MSPSLRRRLGVALLFLVTPPSVTAAELGALLPGDAEIVVSLNVRRFLDDNRNTEVVQGWLEPWGLAVRADAHDLKAHYREKDLWKTIGITEEQYLRWASRLRGFNEALAMNVLKDIDRVTIGFKMNDADFLVVLVEGRFKEEKVATAIPQLARELFGSSRMSRVKNVAVWQVPDRAEGVLVALLNPQTLVFTNGKNEMDGVLARSAGKMAGGLSANARALLDSVGNEQVGFVINDLNAAMNQAIRFAENATVNSPAAADADKAFLKQLVAWGQTAATDCPSAAEGLSIGPDNLRLRFAITGKDLATAEKLRSTITQANQAASLALRISGTDLNRQAADILARTHITAKDTLVVVQAELPCEFIYQNILAVWNALQGPVDSVARRLMRIRLWGPLTPRPPDALKVDEQLDIAYRNDSKADSFRHRLDLFVPRGKKDFPVAVLVHGGSWFMGDNCCGGLYTSVGQFLASRGIGAVLPNYRLSPAVQHPAHVQDVASAVAWTRKRIGHYGGDPERIYLMGHSAGGHLVSLLASDESYLKAEGLSAANIKGVISVSGVYHIPPGSRDWTLGGSGPRSVRLDQNSPVRGERGAWLDWTLPGIPIRLDPFGIAFGNDPKLRASASPLTHVRLGLPPFLILTAADDLPGQQDQADEFQQALNRAEVKVRQVKVDRRNHASVMFSAIGLDDPVAQAVLEFVGRDEKKKR